MPNSILYFSKLIFFRMHVHVKTEKEWWEA